MRNGESLRTRDAVLAASLLLLLPLSPPASAAARLNAEAQLSNQGDSVTAIVPDMILRTGDAVRFKISSDTSAYVYLIVVGSSGTAQVLQPLSGKPADAWMGAGEERSIPRDGEFLPLDEQTGSEIILVLSSSAPLPNMTRILVRLEDAAPDLGAMQQVLSNAGLIAKMLAFRHLDAITAPAASVPASPAQPSVAATQSPIVSSAQAVEPAVTGSDNGRVVVLGGLGSRISAFQSNQAIPPQLGAEATQQVEEVLPFQAGADQTSADTDTDTDTDTDKDSSLGASLASWFGFGSDPKPEPEQVDAETTTQAGADTFPLQARIIPPTPSVIAPPEDPQPSPPDSPPKGGGGPVVSGPEIQSAEAEIERQPETGRLPATGSKSGVRMVEPLAIEKTLQDSSRPPPGTLSDTTASSDSPEPEFPQDGRVAGVLASLFGPTPAAAGSADSTSFSSRPGQAQAQESEPSGAVEAAPLPMLLNLPDSETPPESGNVPADTQGSLELSPAAARQPAVGEADPRAQAPGQEQENISRAVTEPEQEQGQGQEAEPIEEQEPVPGQEPESADSGGGGLFSWLTGGRDDASAGSAAQSRDGADSDPAAEEVDERNNVDEITDSDLQIAALDSSPQPSPATAEAGADVATQDQEEAPEPEPANSGSGGLFSWLSGANKAGSSRENANGAPDETDNRSPDAGLERIDSSDSNTAGDTEPGSEAPAAQASAPVASEDMSAPVEALDDSENTQLRGSESSDTEDEPAADNANLVKQDREAEDNTGPGLFSWLTNTQQDNSAADSAAELPRDEVLPQEQEETAPESPGFLAGLGALFGGGSRGSDKVPDVDVEAVEPPVEKNYPPPLQTEPTDTPAPAMTRRKNAQGESVVMLSGPETPPRQVARAADENSQVLSGQGSRIQALLAQNSGSIAQQQPESESRASAPAAMPDTERGVDAGASRQDITPDPGPVAGAGAIAPAAATGPEPAADAETSTQAVMPGPEPEQSAAPSPAPAPAASVAAPGTALSPLRLNPQESQRAVTQLALNAAPVQALKQAAEGARKVDLSDDNGLAGAVVLVISPTGTGAGVVINEAGQVLTNWHLVEGLDSVAVAFKQAGEAQISSSSLRRAQVLRHSKYPDLALLAVDGGSPVAPAKIVAGTTSGRGKTARGARLHTLSLGDGGTWQASVIKVERVRAGSSWYSGRRVLHRATVIRANYENRPGLSGAPLFNENGEIAGMTTLIKTGKNQLIAVSAQTVRRFLEPPQ